MVQAIDRLEAEPESAGHREGLQKEIITVNAELDHEVIAAAEHMLAQIHPQQVVMSKFTTQNSAPVQGQTIGDHNTITQQFGEMPKA